MVSTAGFPDDRPVTAVLNSGPQAAILNLGNAWRGVSRSARRNACHLASVEEAPHAREAESREA
jgi:hypothetical protein